MKILAIWITKGLFIFVICIAEWNVCSNLRVITYNPTVSLGELQQTWSFVFENNKMIFISLAINKGVQDSNSVKGYIGYNNVNPTRIICTFLDGSMSIIGIGFLQINPNGSFETHFTNNTNWVWCLSNGVTLNKAS